MLGRRDLCEQRLGWPTAFQKVPGRFGLHHTRPTLGAGVSRAHGDDHLIGRRDVIQPLGLVLTDPDHVAATALAGDAVGFDQAFHARQMFRQRPGLARRTWLAFLGVRLAGCDLLLDGGDLRLRFGDGRFEIVQRQWCCAGSSFSDFGPNFACRYCLIWPSSFLITAFRSVMKASFSAPTACSCWRATLDLQFELQRRNCLHHLRRQVRELGQIVGLRHGPCYPGQAEKPNKTTPENRA